MNQGKSSTMERKDSRDSSEGDRSGRSSQREGGYGGLEAASTEPSSRQPGKPPGGLSFAAYKPEQGKYTRMGTFVAGAALVAWGAYFIYERLQVYQGDDWQSLLITTGIPLACAAIGGWAAWWLTFANRGAGDFMIATEGEMKKVSWSTRREVIGSTKVVILFTVLFAAYLFLVDVVFQRLFSWIGVLRV